MANDASTAEQELLAIRCQLGEAAAFDELVARWHTLLWQYHRKMTERNELADELAQETWLRILRGIAKLREPSSLVPWMFGIARRVLMDRLRQKYKQAAMVEDTVDELPAAASKFDDRREELTAMMEGLDRLPPAPRELLILYYLDELSVEEVAQVLAVPMGTVKSRLYHARQMLKKSLLAEEL